MRPFRHSLAAAAFALCLGPAAADPSPQDREGAQAAISGQIEALGRDDGLAAYAYAADAIRTMFPTPEVFLDMVRKGYAPVYRPKSRVFGSISEVEGGVAQEVLITDADGIDWVARYTLARDAEGRWRITGCQLVKNDRQSA